MDGGGRWDGCSRDFAGLKVSPLRRGEVLTRLQVALDRVEPLTVTFINPDYARRAMKTSGWDAINAFDLVLVDGNGVRLLTPLFGFTVPERLDTDSLATALFARPRRAGRQRVPLRVRSRGGAGRAANLGRVRPDLVVAGVEHGYHDVERGHPGRYRRRGLGPDRRRNQRLGRGRAAGQPADAASAALGSAARCRDQRTRRHHDGLLPRPLGRVGRSRGLVLSALGGCPSPELVLPLDPRASPALAALHDRDRRVRRAHRPHPAQASWAAGTITARSATAPRRRPAAPRVPTCAIDVDNGTLAR